MSFEESLSLLKKLFWVLVQMAWLLIY
jgi:hypothetical protein